MSAPREPADVLRDASEAARLGQVFLTRHAEERMDERCVTIDDVLAALETATAAKWDAEKETWRVTGGRDLDGDELRVVIRTPLPVVVVTTF